MKARDRKPAGGDPRPCKRFPEELARQTASLYALGALSDDERAEFDAHLGEGCAFCAEEARESLETLAEVAKGAGPEPLDADLKARMRRGIAARIESGASAQPWKAWGSTSPAAAPPGGLHIVRGGDEGFLPAGAPGVFAKRLFVDPVRRYVTMLVRMEPGAAYPSHRHAGHEECYVLDGDLQLDKTPGAPALEAGDYQCAAAESHHGVQWTKNGCLLLIVSSQDDELSP
jgi:quercetin dioxygenase-like cupin family protein